MCGNGKVSLFAATDAAVISANGDSGPTSEAAKTGRCVTCPQSQLKQSPVPLQPRRSCSPLDIVYSSPARILSMALQASKPA